MPFQDIAGTGERYALVCFDKKGVERPDDPDASGGKLSDRVIEDLKTGAYTSVFLFSHGWKGDIPAAIKQYDKWIQAMIDQLPDREKMSSIIPGFKPYWIGVHWPSQPWGDEEFAASDGSFDAPATPLSEIKEAYLARFGDDPEIRQALETIFEHARKDAAAAEFPGEVREAYRKLHKALGLAEGGSAGAAPGADNPEFDPNVFIESDDVSFGGFNIGGILSPLRQLSFWLMKKRANTVGEGGLHDFLVRMMNAAPNARFHLMGHSFGCIVVSSMVGGPAGKASLPRPVDSMALVQGAFSLWSYCDDIPHQRGTPGYFREIRGLKKVRGPIITTRSKFDAAVGRFYPLGVRVTGDVAFDPEELPKFGGVGTFGLRGLSTVESSDESMLPKDKEYAFRPGVIHNLKSDEYIRANEGVSGAHSDIAGPEVAHAIWQAAIAGAKEKGIGS